MVHQSENRTNFHPSSSKATKKSSSDGGRSCLKSMNSFGRPISFGRPMFWIWFCSYQHELMLFSLQDVFEFWWTLNQHHLESIPGALFLKFLPKMQLDKGLFFNCSHVRISASASGTATFALTMSCAFDYSGSILSICCFWYFSSLTTSIFLVNLKISIGVDYCFFYMVMDNRRFDFC